MDKNYLGLIIKQERLVKNWSQEGLCKGICTISYLSKIENSIATPSDQIVELLFKRLGLNFSVDLESEAKLLAEEIYTNLFSGFSKKAYKAIKNINLEKYEKTSSGLDFLLLQSYLIENQENKIDKSLLSYMDNRQLAIYKLIKQNYSEAILYYPCSYMYLISGESCYNLGDYSSALALLEKSFELAAKDGLAIIMLDSKFLIGSSYCNMIDIKNMKAQYKIAKNLALALNNKNILDVIDYNTATVYIQTGNYEEAYKYFSKLKEPSVFSLHKLAITCEKIGKKGEAFAALDLAYKNMDPKLNDLTPLILDLVYYRLKNENYLHSNEYGQILLTCFSRCKKELPMGFALFHLPFVLEWYKANRQYKKAYELLCNFPEIRNLSLV